MMIGIMMIERCFAVKCGRAQLRVSTVHARDVLRSACHEERPG